MSFHFFKRDTKKYSNFREHLNRLEILSKVETFLEEAESLEGIKIIEDSSKLTISLLNGLIDEENIAQDEKIEVLVGCEDEYFECNFDNSFQERELEQDSQYTNNKSIYYETNDDLNEEELEWIKGEIKSSEIKKGSQSLFKCSVCNVTISTPDSLFRHLRDVHIVVQKEAENAMEKIQQNEFRAEIQSSQINIFSNDGTGSIWKCQRCEDNQSYKSELSFKLHLQTDHLKPTKAEASIVADCKVIYATDEGSSVFWSCPFCESSYKTREGLVYHIRCNHPHQDEDASIIIEETFDSQIEMKEEVLVSEFEDESHLVNKRKVNTLNDLNEDQINWVRKEVAAGETIIGKKKSFKCTVCNIILASQASLTRHLRDVHVLKENKEKATFKQEVSNSKLIVGKETIWKCQRCHKDKIYRSEQSFKTHLRMKHIRTTQVGTAFIAACKTTDGLREVWKCPKCSRIFRHRDSLRNHVKIEHPDMEEEKMKKRLEDDKIASSVLVDQSPEVISRIAQKLELKQISRSMNNCNECGLKFTTAKQHLKPKVHKESHEMFKIIAPQSISFKCESCRMAFNTESSLSHHLLVHDSIENILPIPAEGLSQFGATVFKIPKGDADDAVDEAVWKCGHCPVRYFEENDCITHIMLLHSSPLYCFLDNREFKGSTGMSKYLQHMKNKHSELFPDLTYPCGSCKMEFQTIYEKLAHQKICINKKFECDHCGE